MARILILGGGFGGVASAVRLRERLGSEHQVTLVDRRDSFTFGFRKTWAFLGSSTLEEGTRPLRALERHDIEVVNGTIETIEPESLAAVVDGARLEAEALVVALGAQAAAGSVPGFAEHGLNFYDPARIAEAAELLRAFSGGSVAIVILGLPYPCPPAPYETALLLREYFAANSIEAKIHAYSPQPMSLPVLGEASCSVIEGRMEEQGVAFHPNHKVVGVDQGVIQFSTGSATHDLLIGIPGHVCPEVAVSSGLAGEGAWIPVEPRTLETAFSDVYAIGDVVSIPLATGKPLPKAGVFAEAHGLVVAERISAKLLGAEPEAVYDGSGFCFLEVGKGKAMKVHGDFLAEPRPAVQLAEPAEAHFQAKLDLERTRLHDWFG